MEHPLVGRVVLVVEDEPIIALDITQGLEAAGARVVAARELADALDKAERPDLSAAVLDHGLRDTDTSEVLMAIFTPEREGVGDDKEMRARSVIRTEPAQAQHDLYRASKPVQHSMDLTPPASTTEHATNEGGGGPADEPALAVIRPAPAADPVGKETRSEQPSGPAANEALIDAYQPSPEFERLAR